jgi:hypothetical protein
VRPILDKAERNVGCLCCLLVDDKAIEGARINPFPSQKKVVSRFNRTQNVSEGGCVADIEREVVCWCGHAQLPYPAFGVWSIIPSQHSQDYSNEKIFTR